VQLFYDLGLHRSSAGNGCVEVVELEPYQYAVTVAAAVGIREVRMLLDIPRVQLEYERTIDEQPIVKVSVIRRHQLTRARRSE
jgi:hypothetical protein